MPTAWENVTTQNGISMQKNSIQMNSNNPKIAICIPYNKDWNPEWVERTYIPLLYKPTGWCRKVAFICKVPSLPVARDMLSKMALQQNCDYIFFVDTDHIFEEPSDPNLALSQLHQRMNKSKESKDTKMISGLYRAKKETSFNYAMWMKNEDKGFMPIAEWNGNWLEVDASGLGCCLIDTEVFKNIPKPWFHWEESGEISEDFYFFQLAKKNGYNLHILTDVKLTHFGNVKIKCDGTIVSHEI